MDLLTPDLGTYIWSLFIFMTVLFVLKRYAWNPLLDFLEEREEDIANSLKMAESAKSDLEQIKDESQKILDQAKKEGKVIVTDSKQKAEDSANKILESAKAKSDEFIVDASAAIYNVFTSVSALHEHFDKMQQKYASGSAALSYIRKLMEKQEKVCVTHTQHVFTARAISTQRGGLCSLQMPILIRCGI